MSTFTCDPAVGAGTALHLEVLVLEERVDRGQVDAPSHLVGALLWHREEGGPHSPSVRLIRQGAD